MPPKNFTSFEFVNIRLNSEQATEFKTWQQANEKKLVNILVEALADGYKVSLTSDYENECFIATLIGTQHTKANANKAISSRSDDWFEAIALCLFKHYVLMQGATWEAAQTQNNWG